MSAVTFVHAIIVLFATPVIYMYYYNSFGFGTNFLTDFVHLTLHTFTFIFIFLGYELHIYDFHMIITIHIENSIHLWTSKCTSGQIASNSQNFVLRFVDFGIYLCWLRTKNHICSSYMCQQFNLHTVKHYHSIYR